MPPRMLCNFQHNAYILSYIVGFCKSVRYIFDKKHKKFNIYRFGMLNVEIKRIFGRPFFLVPETFFGKNVTITHKRHKIRLPQVKVNNTGAPPSFKLTENGRKRTENPTLIKKLRVKKFGKIYLLSVMLFFPNSRNSRSPDPREKLFGFSDPAIKKFPNRQFSLFTKYGCCDIISETNKLLLSRSADGHLHRRHRRRAGRCGKTAFTAFRDRAKAKISVTARLNADHGMSNTKKTDRFGMGYDGKTVLRRSVFV